MKMQITSTDNDGRHHRTEIFFKDSFIAIHQHGWQKEEKYLKFYQKHRKIFGAYYVKNEIYLSINHAIGLIRGLVGAEFGEMFCDWLAEAKEKYPNLFKTE